MIISRKRLLMSMYGLRVSVLGTGCGHFGVMIGRGLGGRVGGPGNTSPAVECGIQRMSTSGGGERAAEMAGHL